MTINIKLPGTSGANFNDIKNFLGAGAINVLWFGADPSGVADSTAAIQAALDVSVHGYNGWNGNGRGGVFFPPGVYKITSALGMYGVANTVQSQGRIFAHPGTVLLTANFAGFIFDNANLINPGNASNSENGIIEGINFRNDHPAGGCIRYYSNYSTHIRNCYFKGHIGVLLGGGVDEHVAFDSCVESCRFVSLASAEGSWDVGGIGLGLGYNTRAFNNSFVLWDNAVVMWGGQAAIYSCRMEVNNIAIRHGIEPDLVTPSWNSAGVIENIAFESNRYDCYIRAADGLSIRDCIAQGNQDSLHDSKASFFYTANGGGNITVTNYKTIGTWDLGGYYFENSPGTASPGVTFIGCQGVFNANGQNMMANEQINCWFGQFSGTIAQLPTYVSHGSKRWVTNCAQAVGTHAWGTPITGTGTNLAPVWWDGVVWRLGN